MALVFGARARAFVQLLMRWSRLMKLRILPPRYLDVSPRSYLTVA